MSENESITPEEVGLWRRHRAARPAGGSTPEPTEMELAAWLDGTSTEEVRDRVELALAERPALLDDILALREVVAGAGEAAEVPDRAVHRALAAWPEPAVRPIETLRPRQAVWPVVAALRWAVAAGVLIVACSIGYAMGQGASRFATEADQVASTPVSLDMSIAGITGEPALQLVPTVEPVKEGPSR